MINHPLPLTLGAVVIVALLVTGAVLYGQRKGYGLSLSAKLEPKAAPAPKAAPSVTTTLNGVAATDAQARTVTQEVTR